MTQNARLLNWLETHDGITTAEATAALKCYRLSERIREIETLGFKISHTPETTDGGARVIRYRLAGPMKAEQGSANGEARSGYPVSAPDTPIYHSKTGKLIGYCI